MRTLEVARVEDLQQCVEIIDMGRRFQQTQGLVQWTEDYPNIDTIREDMKNAKGYVLRVDGVVAGYMCIDFDGEPAYDEIKGEGEQRSLTRWSAAWRSIVILGEWGLRTVPLR